MHLQSRALRNSPKFNEIQCIVCAGKLVFLTMHSFYFVFKTFPMPISFSLSFLVFFFFFNIAWVFWIYFSSLCNCARVVWAGLSRTVTGGSGRGAVLERGEEGPVPIAHPRPTPPPSIRALPFPSSGYLLASFLAITHKSWVLIANEVFISFLCFLTLPLKTHLWGIRDKKKNPSKLTTFGKQQRRSLRVFPVRQNPALGSFHCLHGSVQLQHGFLQT